ncbi:flagellin [Thalassotalea sp. LPB0316]|uniref:flagellin n=1 Tax=Thalassotalea sp. LPB0316 TaxID=2769490 RepID=UPI001866EF39|nr:flagellin [Thalassotalea sp. LPB0316]QOL26604.1 flagellin [Thalassotalea sp. LPB0316]
MPLTINTSSSSINTLNRLTEKKDEKQEQLASGKRINDAADDPAGLQITNRLTSQINGNTQLSVNAQDQINLNNVQSAQFSSITDSLQRASVLAVQAGNPLADQGAIQDEFSQIANEVNALASEALGQDDFLTGLDASDPAASQAAIESALSTVSTSASETGAASNALASQVSTYQTSVVNLSDSRSRILDTDIAQAVSEQAKLDTLLQTTITTKKEEEARKGLFINQLV